MSFKKAAIKLADKDETAYQLTNEPCKGAYVAVKVTTEVKKDVHGAFGGFLYKVDARQINKRGLPLCFPGTDVVISSHYRHLALGGTEKEAKAVEEMLDGKLDAKPTPVASPIRVAIQAAENLKQS